MQPELLSVPDGLKVFWALPGDAATMETLPLSPQRSALLMPMVLRKFFLLTTAGKAMTLLSFSQKFMTVKPMTPVWNFPVGIFLNLRIQIGILSAVSPLGQKTFCLTAAVQFRK